MLKILDPFSFLLLDGDDEIITAQPNQSDDFNGDGVVATTGGVQNTARFSRRLSQAKSSCKRLYSSNIYGDWTTLPPCVIARRDKIISSFQPVACTELTHACLLLEVSPSTPSLEGVNWPTPFKNIFGWKSSCGKYYKLDPLSFISNTHNKHDGKPFIK